MKHNLNIIAMTDKELNDLYIDVQMERMLRAQTRVDEDEAPQPSNEEEKLYREGYRFRAIASYMKRTGEPLAVAMAVFPVVIAAMAE